jgi:hypothetical protein
MEIEIIDKGIINTNTMSDRDAEIYEAVNNIYLLCKKYNLSAYMVIPVGKEKSINMTSMVQNDPQKLEEDFLVMMTSIAQTVEKLSGGKCALMKQDE